MCLLDAEDYSDLPIRQYEEDNVLRELNKAYLGFRQPERSSGSIEKRLPPVGASRDSSPSRKQQQQPTASVAVAVKEDSPMEEDDQRRSSNPTLLYGGGRNAPLTLTNATAATVVPDVSLLRPPPLMADAKKSSGSTYASCDSQHDGSVEEFRSANTSLDEEDKAPAPSSNGWTPGDIRPDEQPAARSHSSLESDSSSE